MSSQKNMKIVRMDVDDLLIKATTVHKAMKQMYRNRLTPLIRVP